jgi:hypothetical protein
MHALAGEQDMGPRVLLTNFRGMVHIRFVSLHVFELVQVGRATAFSLSQLLTGILGGTGKLVVSEFSHACPVEMTYPVYLRVNRILHVQHLELLDLLGRVVVLGPVDLKLRQSGVLGEQGEPGPLVAIRP